MVAVYGVIAFIATLYINPFVVTCLLSCNRAAKRAALNDLLDHEHPVVLPHVSHFMQVPLRTSVKLPHSEHISPS
jgi:hypothetical protein